MIGIYELDVSWVATGGELRLLRWELLACEQVRGVFLTAGVDVLVVLFDGDRRSFAAWARALEPDPAETLTRLDSIPDPIRPQPRKEQTR